MAGANRPDRKPQEITDITELAQKKEAIQSSLTEYAKAPTKQEAEQKLQAALASYRDEFDDSYEHAKTLLNEAGGNVAQLNALNAAQKEVKTLLDEGEGAFQNMKSAVRAGLHSQLSTNIEESHEKAVEAAKNLNSAIDTLLGEGSADTGTQESKESKEVQGPAPQISSGDPIPNLSSRPEAKEAKEILRSGSLGELLRWAYYSASEPGSETAMNAATGKTEEYAVKRMKLFPSSTASPDEVQKWKEENNFDAQLSKWLDNGEFSDELNLPFIASNPNFSKERIRSLAEKEPGMIVYMFIEIFQEVLRVKGGGLKEVETTRPDGKKEKTKVPKEWGDTELGRVFWDLYNNKGEGKVKFFYTRSTGKLSVGHFSESAEAKKETAPATSKAAGGSERPAAKASPESQAEGKDYKELMKDYPEDLKTVIEQFKKVEPTIEPKEATAFRVSKETREALKGVKGEQASMLYYIKRNASGEYPFVEGAVKKDKDGNEVSMYSEAIFKLLPSSLSEEKRKQLATLPRRHPVGTKKRAAEYDIAVHNKVTNNEKDSKGRGYRDMLAKAFEDNGAYQVYFAFSTRNVPKVRSEKDAGDVSRGYMEIVQIADKAAESKKSGGQETKGEGAPETQNIPVLKLEELEKQNKDEALTQFRKSKEFVTSLTDFQAELKNEVKKNEKIEKAYKNLAAFGLSHKLDDLVSMDLANEKNPAKVANLISLMQLYRIAEGDSEKFDPTKDMGTMRSMLDYSFNMNKYLPLNKFAFREYFKQEKETASFANDWDKVIPPHYKPKMETFMQDLKKALATEDQSDLENTESNQESNSEEETQKA